jgi:DNA-binding transcriptional LysR family regulator
MPRRSDSPDVTPYLTLRQLQIFVAIAGAGSTTAGAKRIALSQPATSAALNELEALLGARLFNRAGGRLVLNEHGRSMLPEARRLLDAARSIEGRFGKGGHTDAPHLRLAASTTIGNYLIPPLIAAYRRRHPGARFSVMIDNTGHVARAVADYEADMGFVEGPVSEPGLVLQPWVSDELVVVAAPSHPFARAGRRRRVTLAELAEATWLLREPGSGTRAVVEQALLPRLHRMRSDTDLGSAEAIKQAAAEGLGITCLSRHVVADLVYLKRLVILRTPLPALRRPFYLVQPGDRLPSPTLERFIAHCRAAYRARK